MTRLAAFALGAALALPLTLAAAPDAQTARPAVDVQRLADEIAAARVATEIEIAIDRKDWAKARSFFADQVRIDFTSLVGGEPATVPADGLIAGWSGNLKGNKESLHIRGDALVTIKGDTALVNSNGYAWNRMLGGTDGDLWEVWGTYTHTLARTATGWKVTGFTFVKTHERGSMWVKATPGS
jgi:ketosteroid isomerase-like protein